VTNQFVWIDIPVRELDRAIAFYTAVIGAPVAKSSFEGSSLDIFPHAGYSYLRTNEAISDIRLQFRPGCLYESKPSDNPNGPTSLSH
jgi:catechol 2,3-dioxygenase-like lactoylglutathione lyase family enzyme